MDILFAPLQPFMGHPGRIAAMAVLLAILAAGSYYSHGRVPRATVIAAVLWALFAPWEWYCAVQRYNIRVDLMLIYPVLLVFTIGGIIALFIPPNPKPKG